MVVTADSFLARLVIGVLAYFFFNLLIDKFVTKPEAKSIFELILLLACVLYILFGAFLPFFQVK